MKTMKQDEMSERYKKCLVTVAMGLREECDIEKGVARFTVSQKQQLIDCMSSLFENKGSLLVLKIKKKGFRSEHVSIKSREELNEFIQSGAEEVFADGSEIWVVKSSSYDCYRCRIYLASDKNQPNLFEMAFSHDDHILDHIDINNQIDVPYILYSFDKVENINVLKSDLKDKDISETKKIVEDVCKKYLNRFKEIKNDLEIMNIKGISLDLLVGKNGYDFHDFDVSYDEVDKVIEFYMNIIESKKQKFN